MADPAHYVTLRNGIEMPIFGLGTSHGGGYNQQAVIYALQQCGYRLIDTARRYGCEELIAQAITASKVPRESIFLATKMWPTDYGYVTGQQACQTALRKLNTDYLDLYMLHWPLCPSSVVNRKQCLAEAWRALELLLEKGQCCSIGVSNFEVEDLECLMDEASIVPHVNQCEFHPYHNPKQLREYCQQNEIQFMGYCPLAKGMVFNKEPVARVAKELGKTPAQVLIRWSIQNRVVTIPKSIKEERVLQNSQVFDFQLTAEHMQLLNNTGSTIRAVDPSTIQAKIDDNQPDGYKLRLGT